MGWLSRDFGSSAAKEIKLRIDSEHFKVLCLTIGKKVDLEILYVPYKSAAVPTVWKNSRKGLPSHVSLTSTFQPAILTFSKWLGYAPKTKRSQGFSSGDTCLGEPLTLPRYPIPRMPHRCSMGMTIHWTRRVRLLSMSYAGFISGTSEKTINNQ
jgi:hypothetical protein